MTVFLRVLEAPVDDKPAELLRAVSALREHGTEQRVVFEREPAAFSAVSGSPFAYWVSEGVRRVFVDFAPFESFGRSAYGGMKTQADVRFLRAWWEVSTGAAWVALCKGGRFSRYYADVYLCTDWLEGGVRPRAAYETKAAGESWGGFGRNEAQYFRPGLTWPRRTNGLSFRAMPAGCIFADKGPAVFVQEDSPQQLLALSSVMNSAAFGYLVSVQLARTELAQSYEVGLIQQTPVPDLNEDDIDALALLARRAWSLKRSLDTLNETSHAFLLPPGLNESVTGLDTLAAESELTQIQQQIDGHAFRLYGIDSVDRAVIEAASKPISMSDGTTAGSDDEDDDAGEDEAFVTALSDTLFSWLVGVAFGRFDPRFVTRHVLSYKTTGGPPYMPIAGQRPIPPEPEPFDPLQSRSPGMWPDDESPVLVPPDILVDDAGHDQDIRLHVAEAAAATGWPDPHDLRKWLAREFFPLHIKMYSKSRRKAPIYWQLATPSASYSVWLYIHAFSNDTLFRVQNDYVAPKLAHEERRLEETAREAREKGTAAQRKELSAQESFVGELRAFLDEVKRVTPLWNPNLDDGVILNFAPLWRLVPQHKTWQKELKSTWDVLCEGKYDWAHLAMHLWPERVVPKCATDRSLAIAHGLEDVFWVERNDGKWIAREKPTHSVEDLVRERTSPAVKAALKSLLDAPQPAGSGRKSRKG
jgi:hypothetical protein